MKPFNPVSLPLKNIDWASLVAPIAQANAALARYDGILQGIINPDVLLSPLTIHEAVISSRMEGTEATLEEVLEFEVEGPKSTKLSDDIREIINYRIAMQMAIDELKERPTSLNLVKKIHFYLMDSVRGQNRGRGEFRKTQNWIGRPGCSIDGATYVPPEPQNILTHLDNWEKYVHYTEKDILVQLAIVHAQFEMIHPFSDGNGRVGRILLPLFLHEKGLLSKPTFYLSAFLEAHREEYNDKLKHISSSDNWCDWIVFFLNAVIEQARDNSKKASSILTLYEEKKRKIAKLIKSQYTIRAIDELFARPLFRSTEFVNRSRIPKASAMRILKILEGNGVITVLRPGSGRRPSVFVFRKLLNLVEGEELV